MTSRKLSSSRQLETAHRRWFRETPDAPDDIGSLEQPHAFQFVDTVVTYGTGQEPLMVEFDDAKLE